MPWSTREVAELAGTTVNTLRHYHRIGLLEEPERRYNGYKQYEVHHLVSLLRIRRLTDLGVPLAQISDVRACSEDTPDTLRDLDLSLQETIERLEKARVGIATLQRDSPPVGVPADLDPAVSRSIAELDTDGLGAELDNLGHDADEGARRQLVDKLATAFAQQLSNSQPLAAETATEADRELPNPAQLDVLHRARNVARDLVRATHEADRILNERSRP